MGHHKLYVGGVEYPWSYLKYKRSFSVIAQQFVAHIPNLESFTPGDLVEIKRDDVSVAKGELAMGSWRTDKDVLTILNCFDYRRKFQLLKGVFTAPATEAAAHLRAQLADTDLAEGTFNNYGAITVDYGASANAYFDRRRIAEDITFMTGWELKSTPAGSCNFKAQCGSDLSATIRFSREEGTLKGWEVDYVQNGLQKVNKVTVIGEGLGAYQAYGSAQVGGYVAGDPETTINRKSLVNNALCGTAAVALLADMQNVIKYGVARVINVYDGLAFDVFDTINIRDEKLGIDEDLRVAGITVEAWADAGESTQVEVCNIAHLQTSGETLIGDVRGRVEDDFSRTARNPRDYLGGIPNIFRIIGESETGYLISEVNSGTVVLTKDKCVVGTGVVDLSQASIQTNDLLVDFAKDPSVAFNFEMNTVAGPGGASFKHWVGLANNLIGWAWVRVLNGTTLQAHTYSVALGAGTTTTMDTIAANTIYHVEIRVVNGTAEYYLDGVLKATHVGRAPTVGKAVALFVHSENADDVVDYSITIYNYEETQKW